MNKPKIYISLLLFFLMLVPVLTDAATVVRTGEAVSLNTDQTVSDDYYAAGNRIIMSGEIGGDMYALGGSVTVNGEVKADLTIVSGTAFVHAPVSDDVRILGGEVVVAESVGGDVFIIGGDVSIVSSASVAGDVFVLGGSVTIEAPIGGSVMGRVDRLRIDSQVVGDVDVTIGQELVLGEKASIGGDVKYISEDELVRSQNAVIEGEVVKNSPPAVPATSVMELITPLLMMLFGALVVFLFFRQRLSSWANETFVHYGRNGLIGLGGLFVAPFILLVLLVSILGLFVGLLGLGLLLALYFLAILMLPITAGVLISRLYRSKSSISITTIALGAASLSIMMFIPIVGPLIILMLYVVTLGGLMMTGYKLFKS